MLFRSQSRTIDVTPILNQFPLSAAATVETSVVEFPGFVFQVMFFEDQLEVTRYARVCGVEPPRFSIRKYAFVTVPPTVDGMVKRI